MIHFAGVPKFAESITAGFVQGKHRGFIAYNSGHPAGRNFYSCRTAHGLSDLHFILRGVFNECYIALETIDHKIVLGGCK